MQDVYHMIYTGKFINSLHIFIFEREKNQTTKLFFWSIPKFGILIISGGHREHEHEHYEMQGKKEQKENELI